MRKTIVAAVACVSAIACTASHESRAPARWALDVRPLESPSGAGTAQPQIRSSRRGVILSWLANVGSQTRLMFSERAEGKWSEPRVVVSRNDFFANWADLPSVMRLHDAAGTLVAQWLQRTETRASGYNLELATSTDEGRSWSPPFSPHHDRTNTQHGFASFFEIPGTTAPFGVVWLDGRATTPAIDPDDDATGEMTLRSARYDATWVQQADDAVDLRVCDCCPTAAAVTGDGVVVAYRDRSADEIRDIYVSRLDAGRWSDPVAVHNDGWRIDGCPVNGPAVSAKGRDVAVAWFTAANDQGRALLAFSHDSGRTFAPPIRVDEAAALGRVAVELLDDGSAIVSWIELANHRAAFMARRIAPVGERSAAVTIAEITSNRASMYPRMARGGNELLFAWPDADLARVRTAVARLW